YTSTVSHAWTDWPVRVSFLPVLQQAVSWLGGSLEERTSPPAAAGAERRLVPPSATRIAAVRSPDGAALPLRREPGSEVVGTPVPAPGLYRVEVQPERGTAREEQALDFVARLDPKESDLRRVS